MAKFHPLLFAGLIVFFISGCGFRELKKEAPEINEIDPHTKFTIILPEDHTTGYLWQLSEGYDRSVITRLNDVWHGNEKGIYFNLESMAAGQTTLTFVSRKHTDTTDIKHFIVKINGN